MNTNYCYKNERNHINSNNINSKKGMPSGDVRAIQKSAEAIDNCLTFIDGIIDFLSSARTLVVAKALFAFITLLGFFGIIGGMELGTISLFGGVIALALTIGAEFLILKD